LNIVNSEAYSVRPSQGSPLTVLDVAVSAPVVYSPVPGALPTFSQYWAAFVAAFQEKVTLVLGRVVPGVGEIIVATGRLGTKTAVTVLGEFIEKVRVVAVPSVLPLP